jgi:hypothetical protein
MPGSFSESSRTTSTLVQLGLEAAFGYRERQCFVASLASPGGRLTLVTTQHSHC